MGRCKLYTSLILLWVIFSLKEDASEEVLAKAISHQNPAIDMESFFWFTEGREYRQKSDLTKFGLTPINIIDYPRCVKESTHELQDRSYISRGRFLKKQVGKKTYGNNIAINGMEYWPPKGLNKEIDQSTDRYLTVLESFRELAQGMKCIFYSPPPLSSYRNAIEVSINMYRYIIFAAFRRLEWSRSI